MSEQPGVGAYLATVRGAVRGDVYPPHYPTCLGCGPDAEVGFHLQVRRDGDEMVATHVFLERQGGAPGIAHGGAVATVVDDVLGFLLYVAQVPGVTRHLEVDYVRPVLLGVPYEIRARLDTRDGRKMWVSCTGTDPRGTVVFRGKALFLQVAVEHFTQATSGDGQGPVAP